MTDSKNRRPGDVLLEQYFPNADEATREIVRERFSRLANIIYRIFVRLAREQDSEEEPGRPILAE